MPYVKIKAGDSTGQVCECDDDKARRLVDADVAELTDEKPKSEPKAKAAPKKADPKDKS